MHIPMIDVMIYKDEMGTRIIINVNDFCCRHCLSALKENIVAKNYKVDRWSLLNKGIDSDSATIFFCNFFQHNYFIFIPSDQWNPILFHLMVPKRCSFLQFTYTFFISLIFIPKLTLATCDPYCCHGCFFSYRINWFRINRLHA